MLRTGLLMVIEEAFCRAQDPVQTRRPRAVSMTWPRLSGLWRFRRVGTLRATCLTLAVAADACGGMSDGAQPADTSGTFDFAQRIGWIHGSCIAIKNAALASGTPVALVITG